MPAPLFAPLVAAGVIAVAAAALGVQRWWQRRLLGTVLVGRSTAPHPDVLYFTGASCTVCHVAQRPALRRLGELVTDLRVHEVDVAANPALARRYRVMTLPTTIVLDGSGRTVALNVGFASETVLRDQVDQARQAAEAPAIA